MPLLQQLGASALPQGTAACLGAFDGMHLGHQALLQRARKLAPKVAVVTFEPHPAKVLASHAAPRLLQTPAQRERVCAALGVDTLVILPFDRPMSQLPPERFVHEILLEGLAPRAVVVGEDFRFGVGRTGRVSDLQRMLDSAGIELAVVADVPVPQGCGEPGLRLSSSLIRKTLDLGDVEIAAAMLGRPHAVEGVVVRGAGRGRGLGFPTANIDCPEAYLPKPGIYASVLVVMEQTGPPQPHPAATSLGTNPSFGGTQLVLEAHVLDREFGDSLYGKRVELAFCQRLRDTVEFSELDALLRQIETDVQRVRELVGPAALASAMRAFPAAV